MSQGPTPDQEPAVASTHPLTQGNALEPKGPSGNWLWIGMIVSIAVLSILMVLGMMYRNRPPPLPVLASIPHFTLTNERSQPVTHETMRGKVWIADFIFLGCQASCPKLTARMVTLQEKIEARRLPVRLVSFSVDPDNDTPQKLAEYGAKWKANAEIWSFVSGKSADLDAIVVQGFKMQYGKVDEGAGVFGIMHGDWFVLIDGQGRIRGYYDSGEGGQLEKLILDAERLASDSKS